MKTQNLKTQLQELSDVISGLRQGEYPDFVIKKKMSPQIPVFAYHRAEKNEFEAQLFYLHKNGYKTIDVDEYMHLHENNQELPERTVVLTFDDGLKNLYDVAYPLLKTYRMQAVAFIMPGWIGKKGIITWEQANEMYRSGVIDFQSHTMYHTGIFIAPEVVDFYHPQYISYQIWNLPVMNVHKQDRYFEIPEPGTPIFKYASRLSDHRRYYPDEAISDICVKYVRENGNEDFFKKKNWRLTLEKLIEDYRQTHSFNGYYEAPEEQEKQIKAELMNSKKEIEANLPGKIVRHISFPWNQVGKITNKLLKVCGYETAYGGLSGEYATNNHIKLNYINRVNGDFILRLPGKGRASLANLFASKIKRRLMKGPQY